MSDRRSTGVVLAAAAVLAAMAVGPVPVSARTLAQTSATVPTVPPSTTSTTVLPVQPTYPQPEPTLPPETVAPEPIDEATTTVPPGPPADALPEGDTPAGDGEGGPLPRMGDESVALILDDRIRTGDSSTAALLEALRPLTALGFSEQEAFILGMGRFPVAGLATWSDDFHDPRYNPTPHLHQGNDIWAAFGTPVRAPADGVLELTDEVVGGKSAYVTTSDGTYYYMTHLGGFPPDVYSGLAVKQGQVVGFNGDTGNASGGPPHVHFEIHPGGGGAVNPKPYLDQWVADAIAAVPKGVEVHQEANPRVLLATGELRRFDIPMSATAERAAKSPLLWSASVSSGARSCGWRRWRPPAWPCRSTGAAGRSAPRPIPPSATGPSSGPATCCPG